MAGTSVRERLIGASCSLGAEDVRLRLREWATLRSRATAIHEIDGGVSVRLDVSEPIGEVADLVERESVCCPFYTFELRVDGPARQLDITAGTGGEPAVRALLGMELVDSG
jgi:MerR family transcriptional regulator, copper efflux regulator